MKLNFYILLLCLSSIGITSWGRNATPTSHLTVLQLNIWQEGSIVEGGFEAIADEVAQVPHLLRAVGGGDPQRHLRHIDAL